MFLLLWRRVLLHSLGFLLKIVILILFSFCKISSSQTSELFLLSTFFCRWKLDSLGPSKRLRWSLSAKLDLRKWKYLESRVLLHRNLLGNWIKLRALQLLQSVFKLLLLFTIFNLIEGNFCYNFQSSVDFIHAQSHLFHTLCHFLHKF